MLKAGIIGIGSMGRGHLNNYVNFLKENKGIELVAICDIDPKKFENYKVDFNLEGSDGDFDFSKFRCYLDVDEMLEKETELDLVSVITPTYLHCEITCKCLEKGINVFCEKPMARTLEECQKMIDTAKKMDKKLMIGQCLRFEGPYTILKDAIDTNKYGKVISAYFFRGGSTPLWSYNDWLIKKDCGGGAIFDQHIHDVDMVSFLFGTPKKVSSIGCHYHDESSFDAVSTNYIYGDGKVINTQNDWCEATGFAALYRVNFEKATLKYQDAVVTIADATGKKSKVDKEFPAPSYTEAADVKYGNPYVNEILYFADCIENNKPVTFNTPEESMETIKIVLAEVASCEQDGTPVEIK